jgi:hypothetical protein
METRKILTALAGEFSGPLLTEMADFVELGCGHESQVNTVIAHLTGTWAGCPRTLPEPSARMMPFMVIDARRKTQEKREKTEDRCAARQKKLDKRKRGRLKRSKGLKV